ncbi:MAG: hypothetical protein KIH01_05530 [Candidatus Freyarchaeota archaeon]|nr:hypothetical protein [Candidatus Jordarchaeia archaeon]
MAMFGFKTLRKLFSTYGAKIEVIHDAKPREELVDKLVTIVSHFAGNSTGE